jgi:hypothetical protein
VLPAVDGRASHRIRIDRQELVLGASDLEAIGICDALTAAIAEIRGAAVFRLAADEATVILHERSFAERSVDYAPGELTELFGR